MADKTARGCKDKSESARASNYHRCLLGNAVFINDKKREYLQKRHQAIHADVEVLAARVQQLLFSFSVPAEKAVEVYGEVIAAGDILLAAYTAAFNVAEEALRKSNKAEDEVEKLTNALQRNESLAILRDHIRDFRIDIAYKMQFCSWEASADKLHFERKKASRPPRLLLETTLNNHLSMKVWNEIKEVILRTGIQTTSITYTVKKYLRQHQSQSGMWAKRLGLLVRWSIKSYRSPVLSAALGTAVK